MSNLVDIKYLFEKLLDLDNNFLFKISKILCIKNSIQIRIIDNFSLFEHIFYLKVENGLIKISSKIKDKYLKNKLDIFEKKIKNKLKIFSKIFSSGYNYSFDKLNYLDYPYNSEFSFIYQNRYKKGLSNKAYHNLLQFTFIDGFFLKRNSEISINSISKEVNIFHAEAECAMCTADIYKFKSDKQYDILDFFDYGINYKTNYDDIIYKNLNKIKNYTTFISEYESIMGGSESKVGEIIKEFSDKDYDSINVYFNCLPHVIGDNTKNYIQKIKEETDNNILFIDQTPESNYKKFSEIIKNIVISKNESNVLTILGYPQSKSLVELQDFLLKHGIIANFIYPVIEIDKLDKITASKEVILIDSGRVKELTNFFKGLNLNTTKLPYTLTESITFNELILEKFGKKLNNDFYNAYTKKVNKLKSITKNINLGFVLMTNNLHTFLNDFRGLVLSDFLKDSGFGLDIFFYISEDSKFLIDIKNIIEKHFEGIKPNLTFSDKIDKLDDFLNSKKTNIYYSEVFNDSRILNKNKLQFSLDFFEPGIDGFIRTIEGLIKLDNTAKKLTIFKYD